MTNLCSEGTALFNEYEKRYSHNYDCIGSEEDQKSYFNYKYHVKNCKICQNSDWIKHIQNHTITWHELGQIFDDCHEREINKYDILDEK